MTAIVLSHETALAWWQAQDGPTQASLDAKAAQAAFEGTQDRLRTPLIEAAGSTEALATLPRPLHLLTNVRGRRRETELAHIHCMQATLPDGALVKVDVSADGAVLPPDTGIFASTPEFCFVQMAARSSNLELAELGYKLCARRDNAGAPLTTPAHLLAFAQKADNMTGAKKARRIAKWLLANARSEEQTHIALLAHLPRSLGGMGTKTPLLDQRIAAPDVVARLIGARTLEPDLYWPDARIALEYDSRHTGNANASSDLAARKTSAYRMLSIEVILLDRGSLDDADALRETFEHINRKTGTRLKPANEKQRAQQEELLAWLRER